MDGRCSLVPRPPSDSCSKKSRGAGGGGAGGGLGKRLKREWSTVSPSMSAILAVVIPAAGASLVQWNKINGNVLASAHDSDIRVWDLRVRCLSVCLSVTCGDIITIHPSETDHGLRIHHGPHVSYPRPGLELYSREGTDHVQP